MNYEDDELERMRARREQRRSGSGYPSASGSRSSTGNSRSSTGNSRSSAGVSRSSAASGSRRSSSGDPFTSGYSGPRGGSGRGNRQQRAGGNRRKGPDKKRRIMILAAEIALLLALLVGAGAWYLYDRTFGSFQKVEFDEEDVKNPELTSDQLESMKGYWNIACFGVDSRSVGGKQSVGKGTNADVNLICSINMDTGEIRLVSIFRDTYLNINDKNTYNKINAAYAAGGPEQAVKALNKNLGLNITQYATFNWKAVADAINALGGIDVEISKNEFSWINAYITETVKESGIPSTQLENYGLVHMDGVQAVAYGRLRLGDTDYARTERQRIVLQKAFEKAKQADFKTLNYIIATVTPQLASNISPADVVPLAMNIKKYHIGDTYGFPAARGEMDIGKIGDCVVPQTLESNVQLLHSFLFAEDDYAVPSNVKQYSKHIADTTGMYTEGKAIGHVPVDQGANANSYVRRKAEKAAAKQAAEDNKKKETSTEESADESESSTDESSTDESSTDESSETSTDDDWDDEDWDNEDWDNEEWEAGPGSSGPGSGPGSQANPTTGSKKPTDKPTKSDDEAKDATGPGKGNSPTSGSASKGTKASTEAEEDNSRRPGGNNSSNSSSADSENDSGKSEITGPGPISPMGDNQGPSGPGSI